MGKNYRKKRTFWCEEERQWKYNRRRIWWKYLMNSIMQSNLQLLWYFDTNESPLTSQATFRERLFMFPSDKLFQNRYSFDAMLHFIIKTCYSWHKWLLIDPYISKSINMALRIYKRDYWRNLWNNGYVF